MTATRERSGRPTHARASHKERDTGTDPQRLEPYSSFPVGGWGLGMVSTRPVDESSWRTSS
jgi:hypothetical protein